jgi:hypothetical protein
MLSRLLPKRLDNDYRGHPIALWLFYPITLMTLVRSGLHMFLPDGGAQSIATIPLDTMTPHGASAVVLTFALWGLSQFLLGASTSSRSGVSAPFCLFSTSFSSSSMRGDFYSDTGNRSSLSRRRRAPT